MLVLVRHLLTSLNLYPARDIMVTGREVLILAESRLSITREESKLLKKLYRKGSFHIEETAANSLLDKGLIRYDEDPAVNAVLRPDEKYAITNDGKLAYEQYYEYHEQIRRVSFRSWVAIALSAIAIILSIIKTFELF